MFSNLARKRGWRRASAMCWRKLKPGSNREVAKQCTGTFRHGRPAISGHEAKAGNRASARSAPQLCDLFSFRAGDTHRKSSANEKDSGMRLVVIVAGVTAFCLPALAGPYDVQDVQAGKQLAITVCSPCHYVSSESTRKRTSLPPGAPFSDIAKGSKGTHENLRTFLLSTQSNVRHPGAMPFLGLTDQQIWQIAAYLASLRDAGK